MTTLGRRGILGVGAIVCVVVLIAGWFLLVSPVKSDISKTKAATEAQTSENSSEQLTLASMRSIAKNLPQEKAQLAALSSRVPDQVQLPALLRAIQSAATTTGITLTSLSPTQPAALANAPGISAVGISLAVTGGYAELEQFDSSLESLKRTFVVSGFTMTGGGATAGVGNASDTSSITASFTGQVLVKTATASTGS
jgi:Tfp pilus assembly protein PilO